MGGVICGRVGHNWGTWIPPKVSDDHRRVCFRCITCGIEKWFDFKDGMYEHLLKDIAEGKIKKAE